MNHCLHQQHPQRSQLLRQEERIPKSPGQNLSPSLRQFKQPGLRRSAKPPHSPSDPPSIIGTTVVPSEPRLVATWTS